jgi:hypothetical protein
MGEVSYQRPEEIIDGKTFPEQVKERERERERERE